MKTTRELSLYCDLLEMNTYICFCLSKTAGCSTVCLGTILHTRDCFTVLLLLLNPKIYRKLLYICKNFNKVVLFRYKSTPVDVLKEQTLERDLPLADYT